MSIRLASRSLRHAPVFAFAVVLTLTLGIASVGTMFAIVHGVLLAPLPYGEPDRLVSVELRSAEQRRIQQPPALKDTYVRYAQRLEAVGVHRTGNANLWTEGDGEAPERVTATWISASLVPLLRVAPLLGRTFTAEEERLGGPNAVILGESVWRARFGATPDVLGRTLMVNSVPREIVGIMPAGFAFPTADTRIWLPARTANRGTVGDFAYSMVARLAPGATAEEVQRELTEVLPRLAQTYPRLESGASTATWLSEAGPVPVVTPLREAVTGEIARTLWMLASASALVLLVAWANVANLMLMRADGRQLDLAVREALGARQSRIALHFLGESLLLGVASGVVALLIAQGAVRALVAFGPSDVPRLAGLGVGLEATGVIAGITLLGVIVCAAVPALRSRRTSLSTGLRDGGRGGSTGKARLRVRTSLTVLQIAVALVVSLGSALLLRTAHRLGEVDRGFVTDDVTVLWTQLPFARYDDAAAVAFYARLSERVGEMPSVQAAGLAMHVPLVPGETLEQIVRVEGDARTRSLPVNVVDAGYFRALGIPLLAGRGFHRLDLEQGRDVVINRKAAVTLFGDPNGTAAVGKPLALASSGRRYTVVGVVGDVRDQDLATSPEATIYRPQVVPIDSTVDPAARRTMALVVKTGPSAGLDVEGIRRIVRELDPTVPLFHVESMDEVVRASTARLTLVLVLMSVAAGMTLLLGMVGLYGVTSTQVALRTREFGVRLALGADPRRIAGSVARRGLGLAAVGIVAGFAFYGMVAPLLQAFLFDVTPTDPPTLLGATLLIVATTVLAGWLPAMRAARVDPAEALRAE